MFIFLKNGLLPKQKKTLSEEGIVTAYYKKTNIKNNTLYSIDCELLAFNKH